MAGSGGTAVTEVLVVGAGPTGLSLALELAAFGLEVRVVDAAADAVHESRALAVQARTLEVLARHGVDERLVSAGDPATTLILHAGEKRTPVALFGDGVSETAFPFLLFVSQAVTERVLLDRLTRYGVVVERRRTLVGLEQDVNAITCIMAGPDGEKLAVRARFVVGCDGAHSAVRRASGIAFSGVAFPQAFVLADLEADGLEPRRIHAFLTGRGMLFFFPLGSPATWRTLVMRSPVPAAASTIDTVQRLVGEYTGGRVRVRDPVWLTDFSIQSRCAEVFRSGRVLLAGDAAHIHSPAGAQGMNTGIQDAVNLGWKLALVSRGGASESLLDTYDAERRPVARSVLRMTNRAFRVATSSNRALRFLRPRLGAIAVPLALRLPVLRQAGFRRISELDVHYRNGPLTRGRSIRPWSGPRPGDRFPDGLIMIAGRPTRLHAGLNPTGFHLLLCGRRRRWDATEIDDFEQRWPDLRISHLTDRAGQDDAWILEGALLRRLGARHGEVAQYLVRPDGYIGVRTKGADLLAVDSYLTDLSGRTSDPPKREQR